MTWYAAHVIMCLKFKEGQQSTFPIWENIMLINAESDEEAFTKAEKEGKSEESETLNEEFTRDGRPANWVYKGIRKLITISSMTSVTDEPVDGTEITFSEYELASEEDVDKLVNGEPVMVLYEE